MTMGQLQHGNFLPLPRCPHCGIDRPSLESVHEFDTAASDNEHRRRWRSYVCRSCGGAILAGARLIEKAGGHFLSMPISKIYPNVRSVDVAIPDRIRQRLIEATNTLHAPGASMMASAAAIDWTLKHHGFKTGSLNKRIEEAAAAHLITEGMKDWAHLIRLDANDQRHADETAPNPTGVMAARNLEFALAICELLFVLPARVDRGKTEAEALDEGAEVAEAEA